MGKAALILIAAFAVAGAYYSAGSKQNIQGTEERVAERQFYILAQNAARTGYDRAKQQLIEKWDQMSAVTGKQDGIDYKVVIATASPITSGATARQIEATGMVTNSQGKKIEARIVALVERTMAVEEKPVPAFMQYGLFVEKDLNINGNFLATVFAQGDAGRVLNANMHTNSSLSVKGNSAQVKGFGTYVGSGSGKLGNTFVPNYNPAHEPSTKKVSRIDIPAFDITKFGANTGIDLVKNGDYNMSGALNLGGTREDPYVIHVKGNLNGNGNTVVNGYVLFIVEGNIDFKGNASVGNSGYTGADESSMAFYAKGNIDFGGNTVTYGQIYADGDVRFHGTPRIFGSITTRGEAKFSGTPDIYYRAASPWLTQNWQPLKAQTIYRLAAYSEK